MEEPEVIFGIVDGFLNSSLSLEGKKALVTAGPTVEAIDPVRYISNHSSGKMGVAIAHELARRGAEVTLVCGPIYQEVRAEIHRIDVVSASDMHQACLGLQSEMDIVVMAAAVADYTPVKVAESKIKKNDQTLTLELTKTKDVLKDLGERKPNHQLLVGFALETDREMEHALDKLQRKHLDLIVLNSLKDEGAGFAGNTNKITIIDKSKSTESFPLKSKTLVAVDIVDSIEKHLK
jgi:phosphopantothenoylcysteine decarboxylase/phosphopantothenate--cysteine ligase